MNIPFHKTLVPNELNQIFTDSISNGWITTGPEVKNFEKLISYTQSENIIAVNSCTPHCIYLWLQRVLVSEISL